MACIDQARINLGELKSKIAKRIGPDRTRLYFSYLNRLLAQKLSKFEFNKLCLSTLGRENIHLHNGLIQSIIKNAYNAECLPPLSVKAADGSHPTAAPALSSPIWSNGDLFPTSPRKSRLVGIRDRRLKDRSCSLGPNGMIVRENSILGPCDLKRPMQNHHCVLDAQLAKRPRMGTSLGIEVVEVGEEAVEQSSDFDLCSRRNPLWPPLGFSFCPPSFGGVWRPSAMTSSSRNSVGRSFNSDELCHTEDLMKRMEGIVRAQGLESVTMDCANLLNNGLDTYLKQLVKSCFQLVVLRSEQEAVTQLDCPQYSQMKPLNGIWQRNGPNGIHALSSGIPLDGKIKQRSCKPVSLQDFKVAMELNPKQLGEFWPLILEKISLRSFEE